MGLPGRSWFERKIGELVNWKIMHVRKKGVKKSQQKFVVDGEAAWNVVEYEYLRCIINEYAECRFMVNCRTKVGARVFCARLRKYKIAIGEVKGESFMRLLEALVDLVLLYGAEVWGCCIKTD